MAPGLWQREPDFVQFDYNHPTVDVFFEENKPIVIIPGSRLTCLLSRGPMGNWNGYVGVDSDSPLFGVGIDEIYEIPKGVWVHGGLTYASRILPFKPSEERPQEYLRYVHNRKGWAKKKWFFGFDCGHSGDVSPNKTMMRFSSLLAGVYRDQEYVVQEVKNLATWILKIETAVAQSHPTYIYSRSQLKPETFSL